MTTPRIEEMVEELLKEAINDFDMAKASAGREVSFSYWFRDEMTKALTQAHQAGRDEAVERIRKNYIEPVPEANGSDIDDYMRGYNQALDNTIKALQDNKSR